MLLEEFPGVLHVLPAQSPKYKKHNSNIFWKNKSPTSGQFCINASTTFNNFSRSELYIKKTANINLDKILPNLQMFENENNV